MDYYTEQLKIEFDALDWDEVYDFVEYIIQNSGRHKSKVISELNRVFF